MKPRVLLIYPHLHRKEFFYARFPPLGLEYLAAYIREFAEVRILDYRFEQEVARAVRELDPTHIGIGVLNLVRAHDAYRVASLCREAAGGAAMIVGGGLHATLCPDEVLDHGFDVVVRGEGEVTFAELIRSGDLKGVKGISYIRNGEVVHNPEMPLVKDLDDLPLPARDLRSPKADYSMNRGLMKADTWTTSRGCTGDCSFCSPAVFYRGRWRAHSPARALEDLRRIEAPWVVLSDDHFMGDLARVEELCDRILAAGIRKSFFFQTRMMPCDRELKRKMARAGFRMLTFGVEGTSGDKTDRYGKPLSIEATKEFIREWREVGAELINGSFVFAHPDDSREDLLGFGDFAREIDLDFADFIFLTPYPGTQVYDEYSKKGLILTTDWRRYTQGTLLVKHPSLGDVEMRNAKRMAFLRFMTPLKISRVLGLVSRYFTQFREDEQARFATLKGSYIGYMNRHLLYGNHYEASAYEGLPEYGEKEISKRELLSLYFRDHVNELPRRERDMTSGLNELVRPTGLGRLFRLVRRINFSVLIKDGRKIRTCLNVKVRDGEVESAVFEKDGPVSRLRIKIDVNDVPVLESESHLANLIEMVTAPFRRFLPRRDNQGKE